MGKNRDWCSKKGIKAHQKGMEMKESRPRKICYAFLFAAALLFCVILGGMHTERA